MRDHLKQIAYYLGVVIIGVAFGLAIQFVSADWSEPTAAPTACPAGFPGCDAPVNVGASTQTKTGNFIANSLGAGSLNITSNANIGGTVTASGLRMTTGAGEGKVLTSDAGGNASWKPASGGGGGITSISAGSGIVLSPNPITSSGSIAVDTSSIQKRVTGACPAGKAMTAINVDGTVACAASSCSPATSPISCRVNSSLVTSCSASCPSGYVITSWSCAAGATSISGNTGTCSTIGANGSGVCTKICP